MTTIDHLLKLRQARQDAEDTLKARYSFEARIAYDNAADAFEYALSAAAEDLLKMVETGQAHERRADAGLLAALEAVVDESEQGHLRELARAAINAAKGHDNAEG